MTVPLPQLKPITFAAPSFIIELPFEATDEVVKVVREEVPDWVFSVMRVGHAVIEVRLKLLDVDTESMAERLTERLAHFLPGYEDGTTGLQARGNLGQGWIATKHDFDLGVLTGRAPA